MPKPNSKNTNSHGDNSANLSFEANLVDCMVALPGQLFYRTQIPVCLRCRQKSEAVGFENIARLFVGEA